MSQLEKKIKAISWSTLKLIDGAKASPPIPSLLRQLVSPTAKTRSLALKTLHEVLYDDGAVATAAAPTLTLALELAIEDGFDERAGVLALAAKTLLADQPLPLPMGLHRGDAAVKKAFARGARRAVLESLLELAPVVVPLLDDPSTEVRAQCAYLLGLLATERRDLGVALERRLGREKDPLVAGGLMIALGLYARAAGRKDLAGTSAAASPVVDGCAIIAKALASGEVAETVEAQLAAMVALTPEPGTFPWLDGRLDRLVARVIGPLDRALATHALLATIRSGDASAARIDTLLSLIVKEPEQLATRESLGALGCEVVAALSTEDIVGPFDAFGLPSSARDRRRLLGLEAAGLLDREIDGGPGGKREGKKTLRLHLLAWQQPGKDFDKALSWAEERLTLEERLDLYAELCSGADPLRPLPDGLIYEKVRANVPASIAWGRARAAALARGGGGVPGERHRGKAALYAMSLGMKDGEVWPEELDVLVVLGFPEAETRVVLERVPPARRSAIFLRELEAKWPLPTIPLKRVRMVLDLCEDPAIRGRVK